MTLQGGVWFGVSIAEQEDLIFQDSNIPCSRDTLQFPLPLDYPDTGVSQLPMTNSPALVDLSAEPFADSTFAMLSEPTPDLLAQELHPDAQFQDPNTLDDILLFELLFSDLCPDSSASRASPVTLFPYTSTDSLASPFPSPDLVPDLPKYVTPQDTGASPSTPIQDTNTSTRGWWQSMPQSGFSTDGTSSSTGDSYTYLPKHANSGVSILDQGIVESPKAVSSRGKANPVSQPATANLRLSSRRQSYQETKKKQYRVKKTKRQTKGAAAETKPEPAVSCVGLFHVETADDSLSMP